ncbi:hypothetical protein KGF57_003763 [Candida theae]|uniref:Uncharacterized protein n=1 Tax=Candida theae TaxID=1198502 RepID=A0AAD5BCP2_9ASCO|nr:uncharacterized protein KGF57_003763 [Candida theae]KAI5954740.1 hypothetical protein KGF57_003763 [Candida theae]
MSPPSTYLPTRRVYDVKGNRIRETIKFNDEPCHGLPHNSLNKVKVNVKIAALTYPTDFYHQLYNVVPSKRIIVKRHHRGSSSGSGIGSTKRTKYLVYPYTTCKIENMHQELQCCCNLTYGEDLDGGLQASLYVSESLLIPIPTGVSLHDVCFIWDIALPFYIYSGHITNKTCVILNDIKREINEVLITLNHLNIDQRNITILDERTFSSKHGDTFDTVFCFNAKLIQFAEFCCQHQSQQKQYQKSATGLRSESQLQRRSKILTNFPIVAKSNDKTYHYMKLAYDDRKSCVELLQVIRDLNITRVKENGPNSSSSQPRNNSTSTTLSSTSTSTSDAISLRQELHDDNQSLTTTLDSSHDEYKYSKGHCSWFWCDDDVDLTNYNDLSLTMDQSFEDDDSTCCEDEGVFESAAVHDMNKKLVDGKSHRICYFNRNVKSNVNASII